MYIYKRTGGVIRVERVFAEDKHFTVTTDKSAGATITRRTHNHLAFQTNHLLGFHGFHLSTSLRYKTPPVAIYTSHETPKCLYDDEEGLSNCQSHPTQLTVQDLWDNPAVVEDFLNLDNGR